MKTKLLIVTDNSLKAYEVVITYTGVQYIGFLSEKKEIAGSGNTIDECIKNLYKGLKKVEKVYT